MSYKFKSRLIRLAHAMSRRSFRAPSPLNGEKAGLRGEAKKKRIQFANAAETVQVECVAFCNEVVPDADGWAQLAVYGDFPGIGFVTDETGKTTRFPAIQRMDRQAADNMAAKFKSPLNKIKRYLRACEIFNGHPNTAIADGKYKDAGAKGQIVALEARADGLYCKPAFNNAGETLLNGKQKLFFSGHWDSDELPKENGKRVFRPDQLKSAGLVPNPNLPVQYVNDATQKNIMKDIIIKMLAAHGIQFANDAEDQKVIDALNKFSADAKTATETLATEKSQFANEKSTLTGTVTARDNTIQSLTTERDTARTNFANERTARVTALLDAAITAGRITAAERPDWERRLKNETEFANESAAIGKLAVKVKTTTITDDKGDRKVEIANASQRTETVTTLVNLEMARSKCSYDKAYAAVKRANPAIFEAMKQPAAA